MKKQSNTLQIRIRNKITAAFVAIIMLLMTQTAYAQTISYIRDVIEIQYALNIIVPIVAAFILLCLTIGCLFRIIAKSTFVRWAISVVIAGSAFFVSNVLFSVT
ncbi:TrbC/VirB2 family protein [Bartonella sp. A5(2022)]|nr:TrbC/VirB2 family protein [Bartonella sp. A05]